MKNILVIGSAILLVACTSNPDKFVKKHSDLECKQMYGRGILTADQWKECRKTGQVLSLQETTVKN